MNTTDNLADFLTKYLPPKHFFPARDQIMNVGNKYGPKTKGM